MKRIVVAPDCDTRWVSNGADPTNSVIAGTDVIRLAVDGGCCRLHPSKRVVDISFGGNAICFTAQCAKPLRVVRPGASSLRFRSGNHTPELVVLHGGRLAFGIGLRGEVAQRVISVCPGTHIRVGHAGFAATDIIGHGRDVSCCIHSPNQVTECIVSICHDSLGSIGHRDDFALTVLDCRCGLSPGIGRGDT